MAHQAPAGAICGLIPPQVPDQSDHDALDLEFARWDEIGKLGVFGLEVGLRVLDEVAFQSRFTVDQGGDDVAGTRFANFQDNQVTVADEGTDHGFTAYFECEAFRGTRDAEGVHIDGDALLGVLHHVRCGHAGRDLTKDGNVDDFSTVEILGEDDGAGLMRVALDDAFFFQRTEMTHGGGLAGKAEVFLDVARGGHDALGTLVAAQVVEQLLLAGGEAGVGVEEHEVNSAVRANIPVHKRCARCFPAMVSAHSRDMIFMNALRISVLLGVLGVVGHAQEAVPLNPAQAPLLLGGQFEAAKEGAQMNPAKMEKTGMLPPHTKVLGERAAAAFGRGDWVAARKAYEEMLELDDGNALIWANLGAVEQQAGEVKRAIECFEQSVRFNSQLAQTWTALGLLLQRQGDSYRAISCFARAIHEDPEDARAHNFLAIAAKGLGWADAAEAELQKAIELKPDYGIAHFNMALMHLERRPPAIELARRHYEKALALGVGKDDVVERRLKE